MPSYNVSREIIELAGGEEAIQRFAETRQPFSWAFRAPAASSSHTISATGTSTRIRKPRKPRKGNEIQPSVYRPHVLASDRLLLWTTPHTFDFTKDISKILPESPLRHLFFVMAHSLDESTRNGYGAGLLRFTQFCDQHSIPERDRMPASEILLSSFAATAGGKLSESALNQWMAGLHFWHTVNGATWNGKDMLQQTRQGVKKLVPISAKRAKRPPVTYEQMLTLRRGLNLTDAFDIAVWAVACIAFWSCCRLGELVIPSVNAFNTEKHVGRSTRLSFSKTSAGVAFATMHIPYSKTTQQQGADISITARPGDPTCPIAALRHHLQSNTDIPLHAPFFSFETDRKSFAPMTKIWFLERCNEIWVANGLPDMPGHGFRIGGATFLLLLGTPPDIVAVQGRWKSRAFLEYWRDIDSILPLFLSSSGGASVSQHARIREAMDSYKRKYKLR